MSQDDIRQSAEHHKKMLHKFEEESQIKEKAITQAMIKEEEKSEPSGLLKRTKRRFR